MSETQKKIRHRKTEYDCGTGKYFTTTYYVDGSFSGPHEASRDDVRDYQEILHGPTVVGRLTEGIGADDAPGNFFDTD